MANFFCFIQDKALDTLKAAYIKKSCFNDVCVLMHTFLVSLLFPCLAQGAEITLGLILDYSVLLFNCNYFNFRFAVSKNKQQLTIRYLQKDDRVREP